jgi:hypothetical protein
MKPALPEQTVPASTFMIFQVMFAALTPGQKKKKKRSSYFLKLTQIFVTALAFGSAAERMSVSC